MVTILLTQDRLHKLNLLYNYVVTLDVQDLHFTVDSSSLFETEHC